MHDARGLVALLLALPAQAAEPLVLEKTIPLHGVRGRIDHMAFDPGRKRLIVAELGNDTVDVIDVVAGVPLHRFTGLREPQGVGYAERADVILIANAGDGSVRLFKAADFSPAGVVSLGDDADNVRIDPARACGDRLRQRRTGADRSGFAREGRRQFPCRRIPKDFRSIRRPAAPMSTSPMRGRLPWWTWTARRVLATWPTKDAHANFPMALDPSQSLLASVFRSPPVLLLQDIATGTERQKLPICGDADDVFFDPRRASHLRQLRRRRAGGAGAWCRGMACARSDPHRIRRADVVVRAGAGSPVRCRARRAPGIRRSDRRVSAIAMMRRVTDAL